MEFSTNRSDVSHALVHLVKGEVIHLEGDIVQLVNIDSWHADEWGVTITCRPLQTPGLPVDDTQPFELCAAWEVLATTDSTLIAYHASWQLAIDPTVVSQAIVAAGTAKGPESARLAVIRLAR